MSGGFRSRCFPQADPRTLERPGLPGYRLGSAVTDFLAWKRLDGAAEETLDTYERDLARACVLYPGKTLQTLTSEDILHIITIFPARSQKRARAALASMYRWAVLWGKVDRNPMDRIPRAPQPPGRYIEVFTDAEIATLTSLGTRDGTLMAVLFDAGLWKAEARRLRAEHCLLERQQLVVVGRNPHVARHTFATWWLQKGGRMETRSRAMGHASIATTVDQYGHLDLSDIARDVALVESAGINPLQSEERWG